MLAAFHRDMPNCFRVMNRLKAFSMFHPHRAHAARLADARGHNQPRTAITNVDGLHHGTRWACIASTGAPQADVDLHRCPARLGAMLVNRVNKDGLVMPAAVHDTTFEA